jgi:tetratricopeptide (TPR) repeat protein
MGKLDRKKFRKELKEKEILAKEENPYEDFEGSPVELFFVRVGNFISQNRVPFFGTIFGILLLIIAIVAWGEFRKYREDNATGDVERLERRHEKNPAVTLDDKIKDYEVFLEQHSTRNTNLRVSKVLADLYAEKKDFSKAAGHMEKAASLATELKEVQTFYYYIAGIYRDGAGESKLALENFQRASTSLGNNKEAPNLSAWIYFHLGRLKVAEGQKESGIADLKKVLDAEAKYEGPALAEVKQLATYLILKTNKGD